MTQGLLARKIGMSQFFQSTGQHIPVTLLEVSQHYVVSKQDSRVTLGTEIVKENRIAKPQRSFFQKNKLPMLRKLREFLCNQNDSYETGQTIGVEIFKDVKFVDCTGTTKGHGFSGAIKRHNFRSKRHTHGVSRSERSLGSTGQCQDPGRVFKNKKMAGHYGDERCTIQNLSVVDVQPEKNLILIKGAIPGARGSLVTIKKAIKKGG